jgi:hypothetical protein
MALNQKGRDHLGQLGINGRKILKLIVNKQCMTMWTGLVWLRIGSSDVVL